MRITAALTVPAAFAVLTSFGCGASSDATPLSIVLVSMDTVRWDHTSLSGYARDTTPNLARLAASPGAREFTRAYVGASWSLPSYATIFTGRDAFSHGVGFRQGAVDRAHTTLAQMLSAYGYQTAAFTSGPHLDQGTGLGQGFELYQHTVSKASLGRAVDRSLAWVADAESSDAPFFAFVQGYDAHPPQVLPAAYSELFDPGYDGRVHDVSGIASARLNDRPITRSASMLEVMATLERLQAEEDRQAEGALLIEQGLSWYRLRGGPRVDLPEGEARLALAQLASRHGFTGRAQHDGTEAPADMVSALEALGAVGLGEAFVATEDGTSIDPALPVRLLGSEFSVTQADLDHYVAHYDAGILTADYHLGRLLHGLEAMGALDHTIVIALSDHGESLGETGQIGHDTEIGDAIFHVPLVVRMPDGRSPTRWEGVLSAADLLPTLAETLDLKPPVGMTGRSIPSALTGRPSAVDPDAVALHASMCCFAARTAEWELRAARDPAPVGDGIVGFGRPHTSEAHAWGDWRWELYADGEGANVASEHADVVAALSRHLDPWVSEANRRRNRGKAANVAHGNVEGRPDLVKELRDNGYWKSDEPDAQAEGGSQ